MKSKLKSEKVDLPPGGIEIERGDPQSHGHDFINAVMDAFQASFEPDAPSPSISVGYGVGERRYADKPDEPSIGAIVVCQVDERRFVFEPYEARKMADCFEHVVTDKKVADNLDQNDKDTFAGVITALREAAEIVETRSVKEIMGDSGMLQ